MWLTGLVTPRHVGSSQTRARTRVPCIGRQTLNHCATREAPECAFLTRFQVILLFLVREGHLERHRSDQVLSEGKRRGDILWLGRGRSLCAAGHGLMRDGQSWGWRKISVSEIIVCRSQSPGHHVEYRSGLAPSNSGVGEPEPVFLRSSHENVMHSEI